MSRKPSSQKRPVAGRSRPRALNSGPARPGYSGGLERSAGVSRRILDKPVWYRAPLPVFAGILLVLLGAGGWLGWQVAEARSQLSRELEVRDGLTRSNRELLDRREKMMSRERIIPLAAEMGLFPPRPEQIRKLGTR
jgi:hypothetical protein